ncbi:Glycerol-3-phosphate acyltransferase [Roseibaca ekhonensis]|jgi:glycerol-3-phosphate O-acyltransferase|uniref:Glycerol-3-phosphate acyltransferase n=1 Tax=Roseinatronobacter ekhonensis TaxID=254356 RepID=A0A3B0M7G1_9RHOB|nr:1-acyl-sn-glycerol-3-phosphate acyltransferase [Roseibaca ekhonensis]SUZ31931.1 Glycerol-3-phosphate acyltransferase [Roseibaca ekhonensis]
MFQSVELPFWALVLIVGFAAVTFASHFLFPSVRWFFRKRAERAVARLNQRLKRPIQPFKLMRRQDQVIRLVYDPQVMEAVRQHARDEGIPPNVAFEKARSYAREIVPGFSTATYFGFAIRLARRLGEGLYDVVVRAEDQRQLDGIDPDDAIVFVMNHRSNMDYVLVTWLAAQQAALSYAVGEWARIWPLKSFIHAMGAYFIRRRYANPLYRAVLARYVQMSVQQGSTQAIFPEGGLSLDGRLGAGRVGLLTYILRGWDTRSAHDVVFVPVALNYDRVLEDRVLIAAQASGKRRFRGRPRVALAFVARVVWQKLRGRFRGFGQAAVSYGKPVSLRSYLDTSPEADADALVALLMGRIQDAMPVLAVPLAAAALQKSGGRGAWSQLQAEAQTLLVAQSDMPDPLDTLLERGLEHLQLRGMIHKENNGFTIAPGEEAAIAYYAASVIQSAPDEAQSDVMPKT